MDGRHALNLFFTRLLFCFFAEDTGIFAENQFTNAVGSHTLADGSDTAEFLTDGAGLRFQAFMILLMLPTKVGISLLLAREVGAVGPVAGSVVTVLVFQVLANVWYVRRRSRRSPAPVTEG